MYLFSKKTKMFQLYSVLVLALLLKTARTDICDPDIPSRTLGQNIQNDMVYSSMPSEPAKCEPGHYRDQNTNSCLPCPNGKFITKQMSEAKGYWGCEDCLQAEQNEVVAEPCSSTRDTTILCKSLFYRNQIKPNRCDWTCTLCIICGVGSNLHKYETQPCGGYNDTICCPSCNMEIINGACVARSPENSPCSTTSSVVGNAALDGSPSNSRYVTYIVFMVILKCALL